MTKYLYSIELSTEMTRVPLDVEGFEQFFFKGWAEDSKQKFLEQHMMKLTAYFMSKEYEAKFRNIQTNIRNAFDKYAIPHIKGSRTRYFTVESLRQFHEEYKKYFDQYFELVEEFCRNYDGRIKSFLREAVQFPKTDKDKERLHKKLKASIIPEHNFREKFSLNIIDCGRLDVEDSNHSIQANRSLGKALSVANELLQAWSESFRKYKGKIHPASLAVLDKKLKRMKDYADMKNEPDFNFIVNSFVDIKNLDGMGNRTKENLNNIQQTIDELAFKYDVTDMLH
jgi:ferritin